MHQLTLFPLGTSIPVQGFRLELPAGYEPLPSDRLGVSFDISLDKGKAEVEFDGEGRPTGRVLIEWQGVPILATVVARREAPSRAS